MADYVNAREMLDILQRQLQQRETDPFMTMAQEFARSLMRSVDAPHAIAVEDAATVHVGKVYSVPVVRLNAVYLNLILPIFGSVHNDKEIPEMLADYDHWHIDWRFVPNSLFDVVRNTFGKVTGGAMGDLAQ